MNIVNTVKQKYDDKPILHIIGGFHMMGFGLKPLSCSESYVKEVAEILRQSCDKTIFTCHCTGKMAFDIMKNDIGQKITYLDTGKKVIVN